MVHQRGRLGVIKVGGLLAVVLAGHAVAELAEFMADAYLRDGSLVPLLTDWAQPSGGLYFVSPTTRNRPAKVEAVASYLAETLGNPPWQWPS